MSETKPKTETETLTDLIDRVGIEKTTRRLQASLKPEPELTEGEADTITRVMGGGL